LEIDNYVTNNRSQITFSGMPLEQWKL